jgi:DNA sulfur modification protein DndC
MRMGPLTREARRYALYKVLAIQRAVNMAACEQGRPEISLINYEELDRIRELMAANTWPDGWDGDEVHGDVLMDQVIAEGVVQPLLLALEVNR